MAASTLDSCDTDGDEGSSAGVDIGWGEVDMLRAEVR